MKESKMPIRKESEAISYVKDLIKPLRILFNENVARQMDKHRLLVNLSVTVVAGNNNIMAGRDIQAGRDISLINNRGQEKQRIDGFLDDDELALILEMREYGGKSIVKHFLEKMAKIRERFEKKLKE